MKPLISLHDAVFTRLEQANWLLPTLARFLFAAVLLVYFLNSGLTKIGDGLSGLWTPSVGAYAQIFPRVLEEAGYDTDALGLFHRLVVLAGTWAEFILPALIVVGLLTRHGQDSALGAWFDRFPDAVIMDQRALWVLLLLILVIKGAGPLSFDRAFKRRVI